MHPLIYPRHIKVAKLEYDWDGYSTVYMFSTKDDVDKVQEWYQAHELKLEEPEPDEYHFFTRALPSRKVAQVSFAYDEFTFEDMASYLGSERLDRMIAAKPKTVGLVFVV